MARLEIRITHVAWRDGRPRFMPGPRLRLLGFKGEDLKGSDGAWLSAEEAAAWSQALAPQIDAREAAAAAARQQHKRLAPLTWNGRRVLSTEDLLEAWFRESPKMQLPKTGDAAPATAGKRPMKRLAPASIRSYRHFDKLLGSFDGLLYTNPAEALTQPIVYDLYERLYESKGLANARGVIATLRAAISWGMKTGRLRFHVNPAKDLGMEMPAPRVRCWTPQEVAAMVAAADRAGRPEIGDAVLLGVWTGQRQGDRLALVDAGLQDGRMVFRQAKTRAVVAIPPAPILAVRLEAARARREGWKVQDLNVILDETARAPFKADHYRHVFADVRAAAVKGAASEGVQACPTLATATDQDLRDTAVTWLARAGCSLQETCAITGHSYQSAQQILKHYLAQHPELADNAIAKLVAWFEGQA